MSLGIGNGRESISYGVRRLPWEGIEPIPTQLAKSAGISVAEEFLNVCANKPTEIPRQTPLFNWELKVKENFSSAKLPLRKPFVFFINSYKS